MMSYGLNSIRLIPTGCTENSRINKVRTMAISDISFETGLVMAFLETLKEFLTFLKVRKKFWLAPIILVMLIVGSLLIFTQGSVIAPFIYTLF